MKSINPYLLSGALVLAGCAAQAESISTPNRIPSAEEVVISNLLAYSPKEKVSMRCKIMKDMNFTDEQLEKAVEAKLRGSKKVAPIISELMDLKHQMKNVITAKSIDKEKARALHRQIIGQMQKLAEIHFEIKLEMADSLTEKQKAKLRSKALKMELFSGPMMMLGPGMMGPPPPMMRGPMMMFGPPPMPPNMMHRMMKRFPGMGVPDETGALIPEDDPLVS